MNVITLRCTNCLAPLDPTLGQTQRCPFCGAMLIVEGAPKAAAPPLPAPTGSVILEDCGENKIDVIRVIREHTGLGLRAAKDLAEAAPSTIEPCVPRPTTLREALLAVGARVR